MSEATIGDFLEQAVKLLRDYQEALRVEVQYYTEYDDSAAGMAALDRRLVALVQAAQDEGDIQ